MELLQAPWRLCTHRSVIFSPETTGIRVVYLCQRSIRCVFDVRDEPRLSGAESWPRTTLNIHQSISSLLLFCLLAPEARSEKGCVSASRKIAHIKVATHTTSINSSLAIDLGHQARYRTTAQALDLAILRLEFGAFPPKSKHVSHHVPGSNKQLDSSPVSLLVVYGTESLGHLRKFECCLVFRVAVFQRHCSLCDKPPITSCQTLPRGLFIDFQFHFFVRASVGTSVLAHCRSRSSPYHPHIVPRHL